MPENVHFMIKYSFYADVILWINNPSREPTQDCIAYDSNTDEFFLTFVHGGMDGSLAMQISDELFSVTPHTLRETLSDIGINLPHTKRIVMFPCYPEQVTRRYAQELVENRIIVQGDWNSLTGIVSDKVSDNLVHIRIGKPIEETPL